LQRLPFPDVNNSASDLKAKLAVRYSGIPDINPYGAIKIGVAGFGGPDMV
jgi:hypothetical protein